MTWKLSQHHLDPTIHTVLLECFEILIADPIFHNYTSVYLSDAIDLSLNSFQSSSWSVKYVDIPEIKNCCFKCEQYFRNAAVQLTNAVITRIFGVQQTDDIRLRSFQEFCVLFPRQTDHFYNILSGCSLDERAIIVLQYLSASEVLLQEHSNKKAQETINKFLEVLQRLLETEENYIIKFVPKAVTNLCASSRYHQYMRNIFNFITNNLNKKTSNIIVNNLILFKQFVRKINDNYSFLKPMKVTISNSIVNVVDNMNNYLKNKNLQYLDFYNIRHFVLEQSSSSVNVDFNTLNRCNLYNLLTNCPYDYISTNFDKLFDVMCLNSEFHYLFEIFLERTVSVADEKNDVDLIQKVFEKIAKPILCLKIEKNRKLCRILTESILSHEVFKSVHSKDDILENIEEMNFYKSVVIHITLSTVDCESKKHLCEESFQKLSQFSCIENFEFELLPRTLYYIHRNLDVLDKCSFLKFVLSLVLSDCDKGHICEFLSIFCQKSVNEDNALQCLLDYEFLHQFFEDSEIVQTYFKYALKLIGKSENKFKFATFYTDTYQSLQKHKDVLNKMMSRCYKNVFLTNPNT